MRINATGTSGSERASCSLLMSCIVKYRLERNASPVQRYPLIMLVLCNKHFTPSCLKYGCTNMNKFTLQEIKTLSKLLTQVHTGYPLNISILCTSILKD